MIIVNIICALMNLIVAIMTFRGEYSGGKLFMVIFHEFLSMFHGMILVSHIPVIRGLL